MNTNIGRDGSDYIKAITCIMIQRGEVYVGSIMKRKPWPVSKDSCGNVLKRINVTSGSMNKCNGYLARYVSPMNLGPVNYDVLNSIGIEITNKNDNDGLPCNIFENYWQYGKVYNELNHLNEYDEVSDVWRDFRNNGYKENKGHRHPKGTKKVRYAFKKDDKKFLFFKYMAPYTSFYDHIKEYANYIESRKMVYVPIYEALVVKTDFYKSLKKEVDNGLSVLILDYDGPRFSENNDNSCMLINTENLIDKINDSQHSFGHGYVFGALLANLESKLYCI